MLIALSTSKLYKKCFICTIVIVVITITLIIIIYIKNEYNSRPVIFTNCPMGNVKQRLLTFSLPLFSTYESYVFNIFNCTAKSLIFRIIVSFCTLPIAIEPTVCKHFSGMARCRGGWSQGTNSFEYACAKKHTTRKRERI